MEHHPTMTAVLRAVLRAIVTIIRLPGHILITTIDRRKAGNGVGPLNGFQRGAVHGFLWFVAFVLFLGVTAPATPTSRSTTAASASTTATASTIPVVPTVPASVPARGPAEPDDMFDVNRVIDGDTIVITDGRSVRILGIDSCENHTSASAGPATPGGDDAKAEADRLIAASGWKVKLTAQSGAPDVDHWGRLLRYVELSDGTDFGTQMVGYDHTGIYQGDNDASRAYLDTLYAHDLDHAANPPSGRECGQFPPPPPPVDVDNDDDGGAYVPIPDNDDDHHHKPRICRHTWLC